MKMRTATLSLSLLAGALALTACSGDKSPSYQANIKPLLDSKCIQCHVPGGAGFEKSGLRLDSYENIMKGTKFGAVVVPGSRVSSTLYRLVSGQADPSIRMPHGQDPLPQADVEMIGAWIDQGAKN
jgi:hypothetical protein